MRACCDHVWFIWIIKHSVYTYSYTRCLTMSIPLHGLINPIHHNYSNPLWLVLIPLPMFWLSDPWHHVVTCNSGSPRVNDVCICNELWQLGTFTLTSDTHAGTVYCPVPLYLWVRCGHRWLVAADRQLCPQGLAECCYKPNKAESGDKLAGYHDEKSPHRKDPTLQWIQISVVPDKRNMTNLRNFKVNMQ